MLINSAQVLTVCSYNVAYYISPAMLQQLSTVISDMLLLCICHVHGVALFVSVAFSCMHTVNLRGFSNAGGVSQSAGHKGIAAGAGTTTALGGDSPVQGLTASGQQDSTLLPGSTASVGRDAVLKESTSAGQGTGPGRNAAFKESTSAGQGTGLVSKDSPKAVSGGWGLLCNLCMSTNIVGGLHAPPRHS